jgi:hypothetical protein
VPFKVTINPGQPETKLMDNVTDASDYTKAMGAAFDYRFLTSRQAPEDRDQQEHRLQPQRRRHQERRAVPECQRQWPTLIPTGVPVVDSRERKSLTAHLVLDTILENTVVVDMDYLARSSWMRISSSRPRAG